MEKISKRIWGEYINVKNGDFLSWYEGLSPIEEKMWDKKFNESQTNETRKQNFKVSTTYINNLIRIYNELY